ncbi:glycosyltransferase domain-containing protein [Formosa haliotis]|uniref:glycosyltransferase domain-containing protein n=1 Tax=Formosa haliotis TaxID=1555194 RepID=UPI000825BD8F|nr:glycosyltransferase domain-containing protein [Formosa haliotis]
MSHRIIVYTAIFGKYGGLIPQRHVKGVDLVCFTDQNITSKHWTIKRVEAPIPNDNTRSNRYYKLLPHKCLSKAYDVSIYIDANIWVLKDIRPLVNEYLETAKMACFDHNQNFADKRDCIYDEYEAILIKGEKEGFFRDDPEVMKRQIDRFRKEGYPEHNGLITGSVLIRKHFDPEIIQVMESWWHMVLNSSKRDQLSFNYTAWKLGFTSFKYIPGDVRTGNSWFCTISHRKNYRFKMFKIKFKKFLRFDS